MSGFCEFLPILPGVEVQGRRLALSDVVDTVISCDSGRQFFVERLATMLRTERDRLGEEGGRFHAERSLVGCRGRDLHVQLEFVWSSRVTPLSPPERLDAVVAVHLGAFPGFFMTQLGPRFLREYYRCVDAYSHGILLTENSGADCIGFVAGFVDPASFYRELRRRRVGLGLAACVGLMTRPRRLFTLLADYRRAGGAAQQQPDSRTAELSSLAVAPGAGGQGVGSRLVQAFIEAAGGQGADRIMLTTDTHGNEPVNRFYQRLGFICTRTFEARRGRMLNEYVLEIGQG